MAENKSKIYPVSESDPTEQATDAAMDVHGATVYGDGSIEPSVSSLFEESNGTATLSGDVNAVDFGGKRACGNSW